MAETKKTTKREVLNYIIETYANDKMVVDYATHEIELLDNKKANKTMTKTQKENQEIAKVIVEVLANATEPLRIRDIQDKNEVLDTLSNQKMSALLTQLVKNEVVEKVTDKKVTYFKIKA